MHCLSSHPRALTPHALTRAPRRDSPLLWVEGQDRTTSTHHGNVQCLGGSPCMGTSDESKENQINRDHEKHGW